MLICCAGVSSAQGGSATSSQTVGLWQKPFFGVYVRRSERPCVAARARAPLQGAQNPPAVPVARPFGADGARLLEAVARDVSAERESGVAPKPAQL